MQTTAAGSHRSFARSPGHLAGREGQVLGKGEIRTVSVIEPRTTIKGGKCLTRRCFRLCFACAARQVVASIQEQPDCFGHHTAGGHQA